MIKTYMSANLTILFLNFILILFFCLHYANEEHTILYSHGGKIMKKILALLLILVTVFSMTSLTGCSDTDRNRNRDSDRDTESESESKKSDEELLIGTWISDYDMGKQFAIRMKENETMGKYVPDDTSFIVEITATFTEDGEFTLKAPDDAEVLVENFVTDFLNTVISLYISDFAAENSLTEAQLLQTMGMSSISELVEKSKETAEIDMNLNLKKTADFTVKKGKIYTAEDKSTYLTYTLDGETLIFTGSEDENDADKFPMIFKKVA